MYTPNSTCADVQAEEIIMLGHIGKLSSHITAKEAKTKLLRMRKERARRSATVTQALFLGAHALLRDYHFTLPMRRFVLELFDDAVVAWED